MPTSGKLELTIKINQIPDNVKTIRDGGKEFEVDTGAYIITLTLTPKGFKKLEQAQENYLQWVAVIVGHVTESTDRGFCLKDCSVTLFPQNSYQLYTVGTNYPSKARSHSTYLPKWNYRSASARLKSTSAILRNYLSKIHGSSVYQPRFPLKQILFSYIGSFFGIAALAYISAQTKYPLIAAPFGAAAVLVFAIPDSPFAQPRNVIVGNCLGAIVSLVMVHLFGSGPWVMALAVATTIKVMQLTKTLHPPGGAVALVGVMSHAEWDFLVTPVLAGSVVMVLCTFAFNNLVPGRSYPKHWL